MRERRIVVLPSRISSVRTSQLSVCWSTSRPPMKMLIGSWASYSMRAKTSAPSWRASSTDFRLTAP